MELFQALHKGNSCQLLRCSKYLHGMCVAGFSPLGIHVCVCVKIFHTGRRKSKDGAALRMSPLSRLHFPLKATVKGIRPDFRQDFQVCGRILQRGSLLAFPKNECKPINLGL